MTAPIVLGIETSCDETGIGIVRGTELLANEIASSVDEHARFGGVVPEIASRSHLEAMEPALRRACSAAGRFEMLVSTAELVAIVEIERDVLNHYINCTQRNYNRSVA